MNRSLLLRLHRWTTLVFALPLLLVIATGLILSFEPMLQHASIRPASLTQERLRACCSNMIRRAGLRALRSIPPNGG